MAKTRKTDSDDREPMTLHAIAWRDCLDWALFDDQVRDHFRDETGIDLRQPDSPIAQMIEEATGKRTADVGRFIEWFNAEIWGPDHVPAGVMR